jgi:hypothetical protein
MYLDSPARTDPEAGAAVCATLVAATAERVAPGDARHSAQDSDLRRTGEPRPGSADGACARIRTGTIPGCVVSAPRQRWIRAGRPYYRELTRREQRRARCVSDLSAAV